MQSCLKLSATQVATEATSLMYTDSSMVGVTCESRKLELYYRGELHYLEVKQNALYRHNDIWAEG